MMMKYLRWLLVPLVCAGLIGGYLMAKKAGTTTINPPQLSSAAIVNAPEMIAPQIQIKPLSYKIDSAQLKSSGSGVYRFVQGEVAVLIIASPCDGKLSIHGYNNDWPLIANQELNVTLIAKQSGRFAMHVHCKDKRHIEVGTFEVAPKP